ncbi:MAG TPA: ribosome small subunit-dependent GTPase A [Pirellulales bacterium]|jgi:ribosome biogenesis GTPase|nr:ribosome small subunit-dependent GTPase A [Pirellulales bacterium]
MAKKNKKIRTDFRKNRGSRPRTGDLTRSFSTDDEQRLDAPRDERISGKGELTRKRTVIGQEADADQGGFAVRPEVGGASRRGRVLKVHGLTSVVQAEDGSLHQCVTRRLLRTLSTDQRHVVAAGDWVYFRSDRSGDGIIERIEPRRGVLSRSSRGRQHIIVANVDQIVIISSAAEPYLKPNLIDRFLVTAEQHRIRAVICINKVDLVDRAGLEPLVGVYSRMGYQVLLTSTKTALGIERLRRAMAGGANVIVGQSGVGKSSLLNRIEPELNLRVATVSAESQKGRHTTTTAQLLPLSSGGYVIDTPGIRQFQLWDVIPEEVAGCYRDLRPYVSLCKFPDCTHTHETDCAVKDAVADGRLDARRYESYCHLRAGELE